MVRSCLLPLCLLILVEPQVTRFVLLQVWRKVCLILPLCECEVKQKLFLTFSATAALCPGPSCWPPFSFMSPTLLALSHPCDPVASVEKGMKLQ